MHVIITGAGGFLAAHLDRHLGASGNYNLKLINRSPRPGRDIRCADISRWDPSWAALFEGADAVVHLAARRGKGVTWQDMQQTNVLGTLNVLEAAAQYRLRRVIFASTSWVMGGHIAGGGRITPDLEPRPLDAYAISKATGESLIQSFAEKHSFSAICFRVGSCHEGEETPAKIEFGRQQKWLSPRDFCHAIERALEAEIPTFSVFNLTSEIEGSPWDITETKRALGYTPRDRHRPQREPFNIRLLSYLRRQLGRV